MESEEYTEVPVKEMEPETLMSLNSLAPCSPLDRAHLDSNDEFIKDFNTALTGVLARNGSPYEQVFVLFLRWEDDVFLNPGVNNGVQGEIDQLERVLKDSYGFNTETYLIPSNNSHRSLQNKIFGFQNGHCSRSELLLVYYGGHGVLNNLNQSIWHQGRDNGLSVDWYSIQHLLEYAASDVAIFLDCCYAASADKRSVDGTIEILAASGRETKTVGVCNWSFTSRLTEVLQDSREKPLTIAMLHAKLVNYRAAEGPKKLLRTPVHSIMSSKDKASIRLSSMALFGGLPGSPSPPALTVSDLSQQSSLSSSPGSLGSHPSLTRVLVAVSLKDRVQDVGEWLEWLTTHMPTDVTNLELIKPEGLWESHSTLGLISMPVAVWDLFPHTTAYHCLGFITTNNLLFKGLAPNSKDTLTSQTLEFKATTDDEDYYIPRRNYPYRFPIIRPDDIVLVVAGVQGAEKIRFMEKVIGDGLTIHNGSIQDVGCYSLLYKRRIIHLISTPADEATAKSEEEIFREITSNFKWQYGRTARTGRPTRFNGIICVHPISLEEYYLPDLYPWIRLRDVQSHQLKLILVTTESDNAKFALNEAKEQRLKKAISRHWYISGEEEVLSFRVEETRESALRAIKPFLQQTLHSEPPSSQLPLPDRARLSSKLKSTNIDDIGLLEKHAAEEEQAEEFPRKVAAAIEKLCTIM